MQSQRNVLNQLNAIDPLSERQKFKRLLEQLQSSEKEYPYSIHKQALKNLIEKIIDMDRWVLRNDLQLLLKTKFNFENNEEVDDLIIYLQTKNQELKSLQSSPTVDNKKNHVKMLKTTLEQIKKLQEKRLKQLQEKPIKQLQEKQSTFSVSETQQQPKWTKEQIKKSPSIPQQKRQTINEGVDNYKVNLILVRHAYSEANRSKRKSLFSPDPLLVETKAIQQPKAAGFKVNELLKTSKNPTIVVSSNMIRAMMTAVNMNIQGIKTIYVSPNLKETLHTGQKYIHGGNICLPSPDHQFKRILKKYPNWNSESIKFKFDSQLLNFKKNINQVIQGQNTLRTKLASIKKILGSGSTSYIDTLRMISDSFQKQTSDPNPFIEMDSNNSNPFFVYNREHRVNPGNFDIFIRDNICKLLKEAGSKEVNLVVICHGKLLRQLVSEKYGIRVHKFENCDVVEIPGVEISCSEGNGSISKLPNKINWYKNPTSHTPRSKRWFFF